MRELATRSITASAVTGCSHTPRTCNDQDLCTTDACNPIQGCVFTEKDCDDGDAALHPDDGDVLYAATEVGVFASADGGARWSASNDGPANVVCEEITFAPPQSRKRFATSRSRNASAPSPDTSTLVKAEMSMCTRRHLLSANVFHWAFGGRPKKMRVSWKPM